MATDERDGTIRAVLTVKLAKRIACQVLALLLLLSACSRKTPAPPQIDANEIYFSPGAAPREAIVRILDAAQREIRVQAYGFSSPSIAKALVDAHRRGVDVIALLDKSNVTANYSAADFLAHAGVLTWIDKKHPIAHNKIMIVDGAIVLTGSFNFTGNAEKNGENLVVIRDDAIASKYLLNFAEHLQHSESYTPK